MSYQQNPPSSYPNSNQQQGMQQYPQQGYPNSGSNYPSSSGVSNNYPQQYPTNTGGQSGQSMYPSSGGYAQPPYGSNPYNPSSQSVSGQNTNPYGSVPNNQPPSSYGMQQQYGNPQSGSSGVSGQSTPYGIPSSQPYGSQPTQYNGIPSSQPYGVSQQTPSSYGSVPQSGNTMPSYGGITNQQPYGSNPYGVSQPSSTSSSQPYGGSSQPYGSIPQPVSSQPQTYGNTQYPPSSVPSSYPSNTVSQPGSINPSSYPTYGVPQSTTTGQPSPYGGMPSNQPYGIPQPSSQSVQSPYGGTSQPVVPSTQPIPQIYGGNQPLGGMPQTQQYGYLQNNQEYYSQQKMMQPLSQPFVDPEFPPTEKSLGGKNALKEFDFAGFKRIVEFCDSPQLFVDGIDLNDIVQGGFDDCWILGALGALARYPHLIAHLFVKVNVMMGQYTLRLFYRNEWKYVTVDDYVPITSEGKPMTVVSKDKNELWPTIIEKAIAKLFGGYDKLEGGDGPLGIYLFTGCLPQYEHLANHTEEDADEEDEDVGGGLSRDEVWNSILTAFNNGNVIGFGSDIDEDNEEEAVNADGIVTDHYYALVDCLDYNGYQLVRLRNPWGNTEWNGAWADDSEEMTAQTKRDLNQRFTEQINLVQQLCRNTPFLPGNDFASDKNPKKQKTQEELDDGLFWMSLDDVIVHFGTMTIGHIVNIDYLSKEDNAFGIRFDQNILKSIHKSSTFPKFKQILKHDDKDHVEEDESGKKVLTQQFDLSVDRKSSVLIALRMIHNDMLKYDTHLELECSELDIYTYGVYVFNGTLRKLPKGQNTFKVHSESRNQSFPDIEVTLLWENRQAHISLNEQEVDLEDYDEEEEDEDEY